MQDLLLQPERKEKNLTEETLKNISYMLFFSIQMWSKLTKLF